MKYNLCCSCKRGKHEFCVKCEEIVKSTCYCNKIIPYKMINIEGIVIYICLTCFEDLKADQEIKTH